MEADDKQVRKVKKVKVRREDEQRAAIKPSNMTSSAASGGTTAAPKPTSVPKPTATTAQAPAAQAAPAQDGVVTIEQFINAYLQGASLRQSVYGANVARKAAAARNSFGIPADEEIYLVCDTSIFGTCSKGLALCGKGIYFVDDKGARGGIGWNQLKSCKLACSNTVLAIGNCRFTTVDCVTIGKLLAEIQSKLA